MDHRYTSGEVQRMIGVSRRQLDYWSQLRLVLPLARWGERFFSFSDLVVLEMIKGLTAHKVPARRIRRAITALEAELGTACGPLSALRISTNGKELVVHSPAAASGPFEPLTGQFVLHFETADLAKKIHAMPSRSAAEWFELAMSWDSDTESLPEAAEAYRKALDAAPGWVEAHINLGTTLYQLNRMEEAHEEFAKAVECEPGNALAQFNLGCALEQIGLADEAFKHLLRAVELSPSLADAHLNLAIAYEKRGNIQSSVRHMGLYLRYEPQGPWAEFARARIAKHRDRPPSSPPGSPSGSPSGPPSGKVTPFRRTR